MSVLFVDQSTLCPPHYILKVGFSLIEPQEHLFLLIVHPLADMLASLHLSQQFAHACSTQTWKLINQFLKICMN